MGRARWAALGLLSAALVGGATGLGRAFWRSGIPVTPPPEPWGQGVPSFEEVEGAQEVTLSYEGRPGTLSEAVEAWRVSAMADGWISDWSSDWPAPPLPNAEGVRGMEYPEDDDLFTATASLWRSGETLEISAQATESGPVSVVLKISTKNELLYFMRQEDCPQGTVKDYRSTDDGDFEYCFLRGANWMVHGPMRGFRHGRPLITGQYLHGKRVGRWWQRERDVSGFDYQIENHYDAHGALWAATWTSFSVQSAVIVERWTRPGDVVSRWPTLGIEAVWKNNVLQPGVVTRVTSGLFVSAFSRMEILAVDPVQQTVTLRTIVHSRREGESPIDCRYPTTDVPPGAGVVLLRWTPHETTRWVVYQEVFPPEWTLNHCSTPEETARALAAAKAAGIDLDDRPRPAIAASRYGGRSSLDLTTGRVSLTSTWNTELSILDPSRLVCGDACVVGRWEGVDLPPLVWPRKDGKSADIYLVEAWEQEGRAILHWAAQDGAAGGVYHDFIALPYAPPAAAR